jgi:hypothetical protein
VIPVRGWLVAGVLGATLALWGGASNAMASTAKSLATVTFGGDSYQNYDFNSKTVADNNVDWPVDLVFWGNASISKVYNKINWSWSGSTEYERVNDGSGNVWVSSGGRKNTICTDTHYRIYAPSVGYLSNSILGHYVIGTAHLDKNECFGPARYGWNETAEANVAARAAAAWGSPAVVKNAMSMPDGTPTFLLFRNAQTGWQGNHYFNNNGYPTLVHVP